MFISNAYAATAAGGVMGNLAQFVPIILMFVVLYFLMIRPQMKRQKEHKAMICLLYTSPSPRDVEESRMPSSA